MFDFYYREFIKPFLWSVFFAVICYLAATAVKLYIPYLIRCFIDVTLAQKSDNVGYALFEVVSTLVMLYALKGVCFFSYQILLGKSSTKFIARLRQEMYNRILTLRMDYFNKNKRGDIFSLFSTDLAAVQQALTVGLTDFALELVGVVALVVIMACMNWKLTIVTIVILPIIAVAVDLFKKKLSHYGARIMDVQAEVTGLMHMFLSCVRIIRGYVREEYEFKRFHDSQLRGIRVFMKMQKYRALLLSLSETLAMSGIIAIVWVGGLEIMRGEFSIGYLAAFLVYLIDLPVSVKKIADAYTGLRIGAVAWNRISLLDRQPGDVESGSLKIKNMQGKLEFKNVSYGYDDNKVLNNISFTIQPGEMIAIVGPSGAGKSSIAALLLRFYDPDYGKIFCDDVDIRNYELDSYRFSVGYIEQEAILFNESIIDNIRYGDLNASFEQVVAAARLANADGFINELSGKYDTNVGSFGSALSGGQRQRIALARAMLKKPRILVLDEPTAALDSICEQQVYSAIRSVSREVTTVLVTHNFRLLRDEDKVICIDKGEIIETGTHRELISKKGFYCNLYNMRGAALISEN